MYIIETLKQSALTKFDGSISEWMKPTDVKIQKIALSTLSFSLFVTARSLSGMITTPTILSSLTLLSLVSLAGFILWHAYSLIDYESPSTLEKIRSDAEKLPLMTIVNQHGWTRLFASEILSPSQFAQAFLNCAQHLPFVEILEIYDQATCTIELGKKTDAPSPYQLPPLNKWRRCFYRDIQGMPCTEIVEKYPVDRLKKYDVASKELLATLEKAQKILDHREKIEKQNQEQVRSHLHEMSRNTMVERAKVIAKGSIISQLCEMVSKKETQDVLETFTNWIDQQEPAVQKDFSSLKDLIKKAKEGLSKIKEEEREKIQQLNEAIKQEMTRRP